MKIITQPSVHLLSVPKFYPHPAYELPHYDSPADGIIATAGKLCYDSFGKDGRPVHEHVQGHIKQRHLSVVEHVHVGVLIEGVSRGLTHELVRHRMFNYSQRSTRYTAEGAGAIVLEPYYANIYKATNMAQHMDDDGAPMTTIDADIAASGFTAREYTLVTMFIDQCHDDFLMYENSVRELMIISETKQDLTTPVARRKWARGKARQKLPHALETKIVMTGNIRAWRHFFVMRTSRHAEAEIRRLAEHVWHTVHPVASNAFTGFDIEMVEGYIEITRQGGGEE